MNIKLLIKNRRMWFILLLLLIIGAIDYFTNLYRSPFDLVFREFYLIPVFLGAYWFGKSGGVSTGIIASAVYLPCAILAAPAGSSLFASNLIELVLFNAVGVVFGTMRDREKASEKEKLEAVMAMAGCVGHELNNPLAIALQATQIRLEEMEPESEHQQELQSIEKNLKRMRDLIKKITAINHIELTHYVGKSNIVDLNKSTP